MEITFQHKKKKNNKVSAKINTLMKYLSGNHLRVLGKRTKTT